MAWLYLAVASVFEVQWAISLKYSEGFTRLWPSVACVVGMVISVFFLGLAARVLPIGTAYAVWTGIGATLTAILGIVLFHEPRDLARVLCLALIVAGVIGLKVFTPTP
jgi:quaternary ammonium compound-resistance protein SugE